ncbi:MAG: hydrophobe/amphiphile efflux-3 (HAE3) family transporter [Erysipelotrichaceae bacterium]|nr:hydrophobe/amphiphile efflux-3 (HAE3) family transporter [Erysipelotrichaceae bacterium]
MNKIFNNLGSLIERKPFKSLILTLMVVAVMIAGASQLRLATGNETLVQVDNPVYISNQAMEDSFGGDAVLILFEANDQEDLLSVENIRKMYEIQERLTYEDNIFSVISPATVVNQISLKQAKMIIDNVETMSTGLDTMGIKMQDLGQALLAKDIKDPQEMLAKLDDLNEISAKFSELANGQTQMSAGVAQLETGLYQVSDGLSSVADQLSTLAQNQTTGPLQTNLLMIASNLESTSTGIYTMGANTQNIQDGTTATAGALDTIGATLSNELEGMKDSLKDAISPAELKAMAEGFVSMGANLQEISSGLNTFQVKSTMMEATVPSLTSEMELVLYEDGILRLAFDDVVISDTQAMMMVKLNGNLSDTEKERLTNLIITSVEDAEFTTITPTISGKTVLDIALHTEMKASMMTMVALAVLIMFGVLVLVFKVKWRMLSLGVIFVSVIATLGFMSWINVPVTMVSMAVFPILIGLGIDYSIQFHNRFQEEQNVQTTVSHIGKAVAIAVFATVLGFISLYASPVPMIQDFGKMLTIGVIVSFLGSIFLLLPIIQIGKLNDKPTKKKISQTSSNSYLDRFFNGLTKLTLKLSIPILLIVVSIAGYGMYVDNQVGVETDIETFMPQDLPALIDIHTIRDAIQTTDQIVIYLKDDSILDQTNITWIDEKVQTLQDKYPNEIVSIKSLTSLLTTLGSGSTTTYDEQLSLIDDLPPSQRAMFINPDLDESLILLNIKHLSTDEAKTLIHNLEADLADSPMTIQLTGKTVMDVEMVEGLTSGRITMTLLGIGLVFIALLLIYRNLFKALIPIIPVILIIGISSLVMVTMNIDFTPITATLGALVLGMGSEMTIMVMERYLQERQLGLSKQEAMYLAIQKIGKAVLASGLTTIGGFSVLLFSDFVILQDFGFMTVINISLALLSTFIVLPPLIVLFDGLLLTKKARERIQHKTIESEA